MPFDRDNRMDNGTWAAIAIAIAMLVIGAMYWSGNRTNTASNNSGTTPAATASSVPPASNNATTGSGGAARK